MPSKLSLHLSSYPNRVFEILGKMKPSVVKVFNQSSEINIGTIASISPKTIIVYRQYTNLDYRTTSADQYFAELQDTFNKLAGRGLLWEGINEPIVSSIEDAKALNKWWVRFAQIMHERGEKVAGFAWSTGNPTPDKLMQIIPYITEAAAAMDAHAFHEYYTTWGKEADWGRYRVFEQALPAHARKPVVITEAGLDDNGDPRTGGWLGKISAQQYLDILKRYDALLMQDPYVLGATVYQWGDGNWPSFELDSMIDLVANYVAAAGQGVVIPSPWPLPSFGPVFNAMPSTISLGDSATLSWQVNDAGATVYLDGQVVAAQDTRVVTPTETTTYTLKVVLADNTEQELTATVTVTAVNAIRITNVTFNPPSLRVGELLNVSITVRNDTTETLQTQGPDPGFIYDEGDTFQSRGFPSIAGAVRVGVDFGGRSGIDHPYRWGLGAPLAPGQSTTITGAIRMKTVQDTNYWVGLARELVVWVHDHKGDQPITVTAGGKVQITNVQFMPTTLRSGELLNVSITVRNDTAETIQTQGPDPGFVYDEGDTFDSRGFGSMTNAFRVGIDFDGRAGIDHPYRWGLGAPLAPGQSATITGSIRLKTVRSINYWVGLVREHIAWLQDRQGVQNITVTAAPSGIVELTNVQFTPTTLRAGELLNVSITVRNGTNETLPTQGPDPGFVYDEGDDFRSRGFSEVKNAFRVGIDFDGRSGVDHPYRWGLGAPLAPGQTTTITGSIRLKTARTANYWVGLVREQVAWLQDKKGGQAITVTPAGVPQITSVTFTPLSVPSGNVLNVSITVKNESADTLPTQGPDPGFVYEEGDTFRSRGFTEMRGAFRVGIDFDGRTGIDHPYRWGLGAPLAPGQSATITGSIRLKTQRTVKYWVGLVREQIVWMQDKLGTQSIVVTPPVAPPPPPTPTLDVSPTTITAGQSATVTWNAPSATSVSLNGQPVSTQGTLTVSPTQSTPYTLNIVYADGSTRTLTVNLTVNPAPTISFTATPSTIAVGGSSTLQWSAPGNSRVTLDGVTVLASGSRVVTPAQTTTYTLRVVLADGTVRTLTATVTVSTQPQPTKPPTVPITPENVALLKTFPRPANDNGRGLHFNIDLRDSTIAIVVPHLLAINCKWTMIYAQDEMQAKRAAKACWDAGIMPIVRIGKKVDEAFDPIAYVNVLKQIGAPPYVQIYNEPGDIREWKVWPGNDRWIGIYAPRWAQMAAIVFDAGGYPGLQILGKEEFDAVVASVQAINRTDIWQRAFFALHNYGANHPPAYPYDPRNQQDHPGATILDDDVAVLNFLAYAKWMKDGIGFVLPIIGGEGGWEFGAEEDNRYPKVEQPYHANYHKEMFDWFRTGVLSNGEPLPDYLFSITPWIEGGWGADDWWGGVLGDKTETIQAVQAIPPFVRKFSWDGGTTPPPVGSATFTATPDTIDAGGSATLRWSVTGASSVTLDGESVATEGTRTVTPPETTTYVLHIVWSDNTIQDLTATVTVRAVQPPPQLIWDPRLDPLGVKLTRTDQSPAWRLTSGLYQNEFESGGNHNVYFTLQKTDGAPAAGVTVVVDWVGRDPSDRPAESVTDANGQTNIPIWAILHPELQDGPYFAYVKDSPSDKVSGMGLPVNRHVNFLLTFRFS